MAAGGGESWKEGSMPELKKIKFRCPECGAPDIHIVRKEIIHIPLMDEVNLSEEIFYARDLECESEELYDSTITGIECGNCGFLIVSNEDLDQDPGDALIAWLKEKGMLEDIN